jgi:AraC-like DNA-binding protein
MFHGLSARIDVPSSKIAGVDALASLLHGVHAEGALFGRAIMRPPWTIRFEDGARLTLVAMLRGEGALLPDGDAPVPLRPGDVAIVTGPEPFSLADDPATRTSPLHVVCQADGCVTPDDDDFRIGVRTCGEALDGPTVLLTGSYRVESHVGARLLGVLPRALAVASCQGDSWPIMELAVAECEREAPGQQAVLDRLLDLLLLTVLREWFTRPEAGAPSWYRALGDPVVGRALRLMHDEPARPWTVASLADEAKVSRATFARRFSELVGEPPMSYLTGWRLSLAADLLRRSDATVETVAQQVGYRSGFGLSVAFKRVHGTRPSDVRAAA